MQYKIVNPVDVNSLYNDSISPLTSHLSIPGSKSLTNRALVVAALANGKSYIKNTLISEDTVAMVNCLKQLGLNIIETNDNIYLDGCNGHFSATQANLFANDSGTTGRFILPALLASSGKFVVDGSEQLKGRPFEEVVNLFDQLGVDYSSDSESLPFSVNTKNLKFNNKVQIEVNGDKSSQFLSGLLMVTPVLGVDVEIKILGELVSSSYVKMTIEVMKSFGAEVEWEDNLILVKPTGYVGKEFLVEPDASSASYFFAIGANLDQPIFINGLNQNSLQGDMEFVNVLSKMGAQVEYFENGTKISRDEHASLDGNLFGIDVDMENFSDTMPTMAAIAPLCSSQVKIRGVEFIRNKESDRISAMAKELQKLGITLQENVDGLVIEPLNLKNNELVINSDINLETYNDHRIAMSLAVFLKLVNIKGGIVKILDPDCVNKTFPSFWQTLELI